VAATANEIIPPGLFVIFPKMADEVKLKSTFPLLSSLPSKRMTDVPSLLINPLTLLVTFEHHGPERTPVTGLYGWVTRLSDPVK